MVMVAVGGAAGSSLRWLLANQANGSDFPVGTMAANVIGAAVLGALMARRPTAHLRALVATGFCGGLTTMSTLSLEIAWLIDGNRPGFGVTYLTLSMVAGVGAWMLGRTVAQQWAATPGAPA